MAKYSPSFYQEIEELIPSQTQQIRKVFQEEYDLEIPAECDEFIARCLRLKDGNLENAVKIMLSFHTTIVNLRQWDVALLPSENRDLADSGVVMRKLDSKGRRILIMRPSLWEPEKHDFGQMVATLWIVIQYAHAILLELQRHGSVTIWDWSNFTVKQGWAVNKGKLLTMLQWAQNGVLGRVAEVHLIHQPRVVTLLYKGMKPFLRQKLKKKVTMHDSIESLVNHFGAEHLPTCFGGTLNPETCVDEGLQEQFFNSDQYFKDMFKTGFPGM